MTERTQPFGQPPPRTPREHFLARCQERDCGYATPCWVWLMSLDRDGYGRYKPAERQGISRAHQFAYIEWIGPIPVGLVVDHLCRNRACCNPAHLEPVTNRENLMRGDTAAARLAAQTHCIHGHEFSKDNTYIKPEGTRACKACLRRRRREYRDRLAAA